MPNFPQHAHQLVLTDSCLIYPQYNGQWKCDNCDILYNKQHTPYHCSPCDYDLCANCSQPKQHVSHITHNLYYVKTNDTYPQHLGKWKCDGCYQTKGVPDDSEMKAYHCYQDQFDLCKDCFKGRKHPIHIHPLIPADPSVIYGPSPDLWVCDICKRNATTIGQEFPWHCLECEFDCCRRCRQEIEIPNHPHKLQITDSRLAYPAYRGAWQCDMCKRDFSPSILLGDNNDKPYHCFTCEFDVCHSCINQTPNGVLDRDVPGPPPSAFIQQTSIHQPNIHHQPPTEILDDDDTPVDNLDDSEKCIVCYSRPKNATIVHGNTGHVCCCLSCAYTLIRRGDKCPICRASIDRVIRHYNS